MLKLLIVDDHQLIIDAISTCIHRNYPRKFTIDYTKDITDALGKINMSKTYDLIILDIRLPKGEDVHCILNSGLDLGKVIREKLLDTKILIISGYFEEVIFHTVFECITPEGFLIKGDIDQQEINNAIQAIVFENSHYYSDSVSEYLQLLSTRAHLMIDHIDVEILREIGQGCKLGELLGFVPLSKSGIEKRIRRLKTIFEVDSGSNRELIRRAREKGVLF